MASREQMSATARLQQGQNWQNVCYNYCKSNSKANRHLCCEMRMDQLGGVHVCVCVCVYIGVVLSMVLKQSETDDKQKQRQNMSVSWPVCFCVVSLKSDSIFPPCSINTKKKSIRELKGR